MEDIEKRLIEAMERISALEADNHNAHCRLTDLNKKVDNLSDITESVHTLANEVVHMREDINRVDSRLVEIETRPAKRWDLIITTIITALCSGVVGFVLSQILG